MPMLRRGRSSAGLLGLVAVLLAAPSWTPAAERAGPKREPPAPPRLAVGQEAPDFELPRLAFETDKDGNTVGKISDQKVRLSALRGKKPVCVFFSSYT